MRKKDFWLIMCTVVMVLVLTVVTFARSALPTASWGLSFHHSGQTPAGPADSKQLAQYNAAYQIGHKEYSSKTAILRKFWTH